MNKHHTRLVAATMIVSAALFGVCLAVYRPFYLSNVRLLGIAVFLQVMVASIWQFRQRFFLFLVLIFIFAGTLIPLQEDFAMARWVVLGVGAVLGYVAYMKERQHRFTPFHLVSFVCVLTAIVSAIVSSYPQIALLKAASLLFLFLYCAAGVRLAILGREISFFAGVLLACEIVVYVTASSYFIFHWEIWGNRNSLGLVMSVIVLPFLIWGLMIDSNGWVRQRRTVATVLALILLLSSYERAGILAACALAFYFFVPLRKYRLLLKSSCLMLLLAIVVATKVPLEDPLSIEDQSIKTRFLFKGKTQIGILGSRRSAWQDTMDTLRQHPWFGTGFGTTDLGYDSREISLSYSDVRLTREHGNSYLAILEWVGLLGVMPFVVLVSIILTNIGRIILWMHRFRSPYSPAVPVAGVLLAGLINAGFEDWMFAIGYHACIFFWSMAFILSDILPPASAHSLNLSGRFMIFWRPEYMARDLETPVPQQ
jgi:O-antigen ligase